MISSIAIRRTPSALIRKFNCVSLTRPKCAAFSGASFSTSVQREEERADVLFIPPNLKIDKRTSASPFAGLEKIENEKTETLSEEDPENVVIDGANQNDGTKEGQYYSLSNKKKTTFAIPLPERLYVPIIQFKTGSEVGNIHLSEDVFGQDPVREDILHRCVIYLRNKKRGRRNGGARTKTISEVSGSGKKVRNQKGGGVARAGHKRPAHWRGGAKAHGPKGSIQNYETKLNKKIRRMGLRMALSQKLKEGNLILVDNFDLGTYKTKALVKVFADLAGIGGKEGTSGYILDHVVDDIDEDDDEATVTSLDGVDINLKVGSQNIMRVKVTNQQNANVYDLMKHEKLVVSLSALEKLEDRYAGY